MIPFFLRTISNYRGGEWRNNNTNCTEAKKLFEAIVFKPEDIIKKVDIGFWSTTKSQSYNYLQSKNQWHQYDHWRHLLMCTACTCTGYFFSLKVLKVSKVSFFMFKKSRGTG